MCIRDREIALQEERKKIAEAKRKKALVEARKKSEAAAAKAKADRETATRVEADMADLFGSSGKEKTGTSDKDGDPKSSNLEGVTTGEERNIGGGLKGRGILNAPKVNDNYNTSGVIVIRVCVNGNGHVISAVYKQGRSNSQNSDLKRSAIKNAEAYKFSKGIVDKQCGEIIYNVKVK